MSITETKNAGASATAPDAQDVVEGVYSLLLHTALFPILAMHWGRDGA